MAKKDKSKKDKSSKKEKVEKKSAGRASKYEYPKGMTDSAEKKKYRAEQRNGVKYKPAKKEKVGKDKKEKNNKEPKALIMKNGKKLREEKVSVED